MNLIWKNGKNTTEKRYTSIEEATNDPNYDDVVEITVTAITEYLPNLPSKLQKLLCFSNELKFIGYLPVTLVSLDVSDNELKSLPKILPPNLIELRCSNNLIEELPELPNTLSRLVCNENLLTKLPKLPNGLSTLSCNHNKLTRIPALPAVLICLDCSHNLINELQEFPKTLIQLNCSDNNLITLPELPGRVEELAINNNRLYEFPESIHFCRYIQFIKLNGNLFHLTLPQKRLVTMIESGFFSQDNWKHTETIHDEKTEASVVTAVNNLFKDPPPKPV